MKQLLLLNLISVIIFALLYYCIDLYIDNVRENDFGYIYGLV